MNINSILNFKKPNSNTKIFALIGSPVDHSIGPIFHNKYFRQMNYNALYVKWDINQQELKEAVPLLKKLVTGLSVTMPLKELMLQYTEKIEPEAQKIGALNTITLENEKWTGSNTDGLGAIKALEIPIQGKTIAICGAGGAARAIIYTAVSLGAKVLIFNRDHEKAEKLAQLFGAIGAYPLHKITDFEYDVLINTLPFGIKLEFLSSKKNAEIMMDITNTENNSWLIDYAKKFNVRFFDRTAMFKEQALLQQKRWGL